MGRSRNVSGIVAMWNYAADNGVSLFAEPLNGIKGNYYQPFIVGYVDEIEKLAETYYFSYWEETQRKFQYYAKLTHEQRRAYKEEKRKEGVRW